MPAAGGGQEPLLCPLPGGGQAEPPCEQQRLCVQLRHWRARISLLLLYIVVDMVAATAVLLSTTAHESDGEGVALEVLLINRVLTFSQGTFLAIFFGFSPELTAPIARATRRVWRAVVVSNGYGTARRFPRTVSGIW